MDSFIKPHCVSVYVVRKTLLGLRYLLIRRCGHYLPGTWQMVTGGIMAGETAAQAAWREIKEETGLVPSHLYSADAVETFYMQSLDKIAFVPVFIALVEEKEIILSPSEHDAYQWMDFELAQQLLVWEEQKRIIAHIHNLYKSNRLHQLLAIEDTLNLAPKTVPIVSRTGVYGIALRDKKVLLVRQSIGAHAGKLDLPGGGIDPGETVEGALHREFSEEVAMTFETMHLVDNVTSITEIFKDDGSMCPFHQVGLMYRVENVSLLANQKAEMEFFWLERDVLFNKKVTPLLAQMCQFIDSKLSDT